MDKTLKYVQILSIGVSMWPFLKQNRIMYHARLIILILLVVIAVIYGQLVETIYSTKSIIVNTVEFASYNCRIPASVFCLIVTNLKGRKICDFINSIKTLEQKFSMLALKSSYVDIAKLARLLSLSVIFKLILQQVPFLIHLELNFENYVIYNIPMLLIHVLLLQWIIYLEIIRANFKALNRILKTQQLSQCFVSSDFVEVTKKSAKIPKIEILRTCGIIYDDLCSQAEKINSAFAWQILSIIPSLFILIISSSFQLCQMIRDKRRFDSKILIFEILYFGSFIELVMPCVRVKEEVEKFSNILHKVDIESSDIMNSLILQTYHQKIEFSACGVFSLDGTLIYTVFAALTTYLVILLQFDV